MKRIITVPMCLAIIFLLSIPVWAAGNSIEGYVKDASTGEALFSANVILSNTSLGAATDFEGKYTILNVP
ncbi:MAG: carboxypeptidase-like regulatory domain-containing protein, partial [Ignavibacteriaceae bacterium]